MPRFSNDPRRPGKGDAWGGFRHSHRPLPPPLTDVVNKSGSLLICMGDVSAQGRGQGLGNTGPGLNSARVIVCCNMTPVSSVSEIRIIVEKVHLISWRSWVSPLFSITLGASNFYRIRSSFLPNNLWHHCDNSLFSKMVLNPKCIQFCPDLETVLDFRTLKLLPDESC